MLVDSPNGYECNGLYGGLVEELADALRRERMKVYPDSSQAKRDRESYPHMDWDNPY